MEYNRIAKEVVNFQKVSFENWFKTASLVQDQAVLSMDRMLDQLSWIPDESIQPIRDWTNIYNGQRERFRSYMSDGFNEFEKFVTKGLEASRKTTAQMGKPNGKVAKAEKIVNEPEKKTEKKN